ncbi:MAG: YbhB/YbcL family Raf kinase inhibitor-like protein, partial [Methylocystis sp.]
MTRQNFSTFALAALATDDARGAATFQLKSKDLIDGEKIAMKHVYNAFGCVGENLSPELSWDNPPPGTKSFAVLAHDPDAPTGGAGFWHWIVVD